jgi:hypothetical protein
VKYNSKAEQAWHDAEKHLHGLNNIMLDGNMVSVADLRIILDGWPTQRLQELYDGRLSPESLPFIRPYIKARLADEVILKMRLID